MSYRELSLDERITIRVGLLQGLSLRKIAGQLNRSPSTISREVRRNSGPDRNYTASAAQEQMKARVDLSASCHMMASFLSWSQRCCAIAILP